MCGIIGYAGSRDASPILLDGLHKLDYRGYDSAGMAVAGEPGIETKKDTGKIGDITEEHDFSDLDGGRGIAHTRWATHGGVTRENAHPHTSSDGNVAVVHNGIVENHEQLKELLSEEGFDFYSDTDTEVIPKLIEMEMNGGKGFIEAAREAFSRLEGRYAAAALHDDGRMVASRKGSPLLIGVGDGEYFVASDIPAFMEHTKDIVYLSDHDFVVLDDGMEVHNIQEGGKVERPVDTIEWEPELAEKGDFEHYMLKEINEQAETLEQAGSQDTALVERLAGDVADARNVVLVAAGTAYHACMSGSMFLSQVADKHVDAALAAEFATREHLIDEETLVIAVSQSGETADTLEAVETAMEKGATVAAVVNVPGSTLHRESDYALLTKAGPEIGVASTKAYTAQLAVLTLLGYALDGGMEEGRKALERTRNEVYNMTAASRREELEELSERLQEEEHMFTIGRGQEYPTAREAALKIKEISYQHVEALQAGELKHGTIALIEEGTPCMVFFSEDNARETISNAQEVKARGAYVIGIGPENHDVFDYFVKTREAGECNPIVQAIPAQVLAYQLSVLRGENPDKPRNLAKSVTVK